MDIYLFFICFNSEKNYDERLFTKIYFDSIGFIVRIRKSTERAT